MKQWNHKLPAVAIVLMAVITACVNLPEDQSTAGNAVQAPAVSAPPAQPVADAAASEPAAGQASPQLAVTQAPLPDPATSAPATSEENADTALPGAGAPAVAEGSAAAADNSAEQVARLCTQIGNKLGSVSVEDCLEQQFRFADGFSINNRPLVIKEVPPATADEDHFRVLLLGGIHGDEYSSISIIFKWLDLFSHTAQEGDFHWRIVPLANPDGLLDGSKAQRQNANGVDLNRNFPSMDWNDKAADYWQANTGSNPRRFPGGTAASEPEVQWIVRQIEEFDPDVIISVHAPYHLLDFDGPAEAPQRIGELYLHQLGVYPGSLGNYAGLDKQIPVVTLELPSAGILPEPDQINVMWRDLVTWIDSTGRKSLASRF